MMNRVIALGALALGVPAASFGQNAADALATRYACVACHQAERRTVGPSWQEMAAKYGNGEEAAAALAASIRGGSSGKWGAIPMPAQPAVSEEDALTLARWIVQRK